MKLTFDVPEELAEKIGEEIKAALDEYKKKQVWPQIGDAYYHICSDGNVCINCYSSLSDKDRVIFGNCFRTEEEAEFKLEQLKVLHELEQLADDDLEWDNSNRHYAIEYDHIYDKFDIGFWCARSDCQFHFKSEDSAQAAIDKIGEDRLKKYYFCIPEEE